MFSLKLKFQKYSICVSLRELPVYLRNQYCNLQASILHNLEEEVEKVIKFENTDFHLQ